MVANEFRLLFLSVNNEKLGIRLENNITFGKRRQNLAERDQGSYYNQEEWLEEFLDGKGTFYNNSESDDSDNDENYNENEQQQLFWEFPNICYKIVSPIF